MTRREVTLTGGPPWGFRITGGADQHHPLRIARVNPGSEASTNLVREGDVINWINHQPADQLTNQEAHAVLRANRPSLHLVLNEKRGRAKKPAIVSSGGNNINNHTANSNGNINIRFFPNVGLTFTENYGETRRGQVSLPLPSSPETVWLRRSRELKNSQPSSQESDKSEAESSPSRADSATPGQLHKQNSWVQSLQRGKKSYSSDPEQSQDMSSALKKGKWGGDRSGTSSPSPSSREHSMTESTGKIEDYVPGSPSVHSREDSPDRPKYVHEILCDAYRTKPTLVIKKSGKQVNFKEINKNPSTSYRNILRGGEIPQSGLGLYKPRNDKTQKKADYEHQEVVIHYKTPILREKKEVVGEEELAKQLEQRMLQVYQEMALNKITGLEEDYEKRRHSDFFTPLQKVPTLKKPWQHSTGKYDFRAKALYDFQAENQHELSFQKGAVIKVNKRVDDNWLEGEVGVRRGIFPINFVEILQDPGLRLVAKHNFRSAHEEQLTVVKGEVVNFVRCVDQNWVEVSLGERSGLVPASYLHAEKEIRSWEEEVLSLASTPSVPDMPRHPDVVVERLCRPTDILKGRLREALHQREEQCSQLLEAGLESLERLDHDQLHPRLENQEETSSSLEEDLDESQHGNDEADSHLEASVRSLERLDLDSLRETVILDEALSKGISCDEGAETGAHSVKTHEHFGEGGNGEDTRSNGSAAQPTTCRRKIEDDIFKSLSSLGEPTEYECIVDYEPRTEVEVELRAGDRVYVIQDFYDGWMAGAVSSTDSTATVKLGLFPSRCLRHF